MLPPVSVFCPYLGLGVLDLVSLGLIVVGSLLGQVSFFEKSVYSCHILVVSPRFCFRLGPKFGCINLDH